MKPARLVLLILILTGALSACGTASTTPGIVPLETLALPASSNAVQTFADFQAGQLYSVVVRGIIQYSDDKTATADAQATFVADTQTWAPDPWFKIDGQVVTAAISNPEKHEYLFYFVPATQFRQAGPITFGVEDDFLPNNRGQFSISIYQGYLQSIPPGN